MNQYKTSKIGKLLVIPCAIKGPNTIRIVNLLIDTGSSYTIVATQILEAIGCRPVGSQSPMKIITGSGHISASKSQVSSFNAVGNIITNFEVIAYTLPSDAPIDGLLGMDFLTKVKAKIDTERAVIEVP